MVDTQSTKQLYDDLYDDLKTHKISVHDFILSAIGLGIKASRIEDDLMDLGINMDVSKVK